MYGYDWEKELNNAIRSDRARERRAGSVENNWRANNEGSSSIGFSTMSAIGDSIAEMYGREYSENFMKNF